MPNRSGKKRSVSAARLHRALSETLVAHADELEPRRLFSGFQPYYSDGLAATPNYEFINQATKLTQTANPLGATSPAGAPLTPALMRNAYGLGSYTYTGGVYNYSYGVTFNGIKGDGAGQTIAIVDVGSDPTIAADLATFDSYWNLPAPPSFQQLSQTGTTTLPAVAQGWPGEISLDVEWSHVMAPGANIILFAASDLYAAVQEAASYPGVAVVSMSFTIGGNAPDSDFVTPSGHTGVSFFAGNGDTGSEVPSPAQSINVVAVGGTHLNLSNNAYGSETVWSAGGGGTSDSESQQYYQNGIVSAYSTTQRVTPDVSMDADPGSGVAIVDSYDSGTAAPWELIIGGTSLSTPLLAGTIAVADQGRVAAGLTAMDGGSQLLPRFYELSQANYSLNYHDVTSGSNGHAATVGYDMGTGIGTPVANNLIPDIAGDDTITGTAFIDKNGNGAYDAGVDTLLANTGIYLDLNNSGAQTAQDPHMTTSANGTFTFSDVIGSAKAVVRLNGSTGQINENTTVATTGYELSQTYNIAIGATTSYTATAFPATTTLKSTLAVTNNGNAPSGLTYTWSAGTEPQGATPIFSVNGTAGAQTTTVTFNKAGTYVMVAKVTNAAGQSATSSVTVTVTQVLTSVTVNPVAAGVTAGTTTQLTASGYDQFGTLISSSVPANWTVVSGGGAISPTGGVYTAPSVGALATVQASIGSNSSTGTVGIVGPQWTAVDIGSLGNNGQAYDSGSTTVIKEASDDIWNAQDDFLFDYQEIDSQNITMTAELNSQVSGSTYIKAGLMIRNSLSDSDEMVMVSSPATAADFEWRNSSGGTAAQVTGAAFATPCYLQIVRNGSTFTGLLSSNDVTWTTIGSITIAMGADVYVGLALSSHDASQLATATFSNVSVSSGQVLTSAKLSGFPNTLTTGQSLQLTAVGYDQNGFPMSTQPAFTWALNSGGGSITTAGVYTAPATGTNASVSAITAGLTSVSVGNIGVVNSPWGASNIGSVAIPGYAFNNSNNTVTLTEGSDDIWNQSDDFLFDYQTLAGNGTITAELNSQTSASTYIKAGLMIRNSLAANDAMAMISDPAPGPDFEWRTTAGGTAAQTATAINNSLPYWLRLVRNGSLISSYYSANGTNFTFVGSQAIAMNSTVYVGLALTSHNAADIATAVFSNITINNPTVATAASATPNPVTGKTTALSVLGANATNPTGESTLSYTWTVGSMPAGATAPTFSVNGTNAAKNTTATFSSAGNYALLVTISDPNGTTVTSLVPVVVSQTLTSVAVSPATVSISANSTQTFTASALDQFGNALATPPTFTWTKTSGVGSIVATTGVYSAGTSAGTAVITATSGSVSGTANVTVTNSAPTITVAALASPSPVTGTTTTLSVTATDVGGASGLTYTWVTTGTPPAAVTFSANANNSAASTVATFTMAGTYSFQVTVTNPSNVSSTSAVTVTVNQTVTSIAVNPATVALALNATQTFTATASDQFGNVLTTQPTFTWAKTAGLGSINATTGVFTAPSTDGTATISATSGSVSGSANITIGNTAPTITTPASANPSPVTGTTTVLSVAATDDGGASRLTYTWATTGTPPATVNYSANSNNSAATTTATFTKAGAYTFQVTVTDAGGLSTTSTVNVTVSQTVTGVSLAFTTVATGSTSQATATDQFGNPFTTPQPTWTATGGTINASGLFTAGSNGGAFIITAASNGASAQATVNVVPIVYNGSAGNDSYAIRVSPTNPLQDQIFVNIPETFSRTYGIPISQLSTLTFNTASDGMLTIDFSNGNPIPSNGVSFTGGNELDLLSTSVGSLGFTINTNQVTNNAAPTSPVTFTNVANVEFDLTGGSNLLTQTAQPIAAVTYNAGPLNNTLNVSGGTFTFSSDPQVASGNLTVNDNASVVFTASTAGSGYNARNLAALNIGATGTATLTASTTASDRTVLETNQLSIATGGQLDLANNALILHNGDLAAVTSLLSNGFNNGAWNGSGIVSTSAAADANKLTALGAISNNLNGSALYTSFDNQPVTTTDVLIKYTYYGDTNLDGQVDGSDYSRIDSAFVADQTTPQSATGWFNGDLNYDGSIDGSDYTLMDNTFNQQGTTLAAQVAAPAESNASSGQSIATRVAAFSMVPISMPLAWHLPSTASSGNWLVDAEELRKRTHVAGLLLLAPAQ